ncbi:MAG TPA: SPFH domain-containing protein, partial [Roseiflexaceae bacterium]|nr:SPFH domain-containing protein [Roseiflexaceae bacterium]
MSKIKQAVDLAQMLTGSEQVEQFRLNAADFLSARERGEAAGTRIDQMLVALDDAAEVVNRSFPQRDKASGQFTNIISPVVIPKDQRSYFWVAIVAALAVIGLLGSLSTALVDRALGDGTLSRALFGPHYWLLLLALAAFNIWRNSYVMVPDGCQALITRFGKLEQIVGPGRTMLLNPWKRVSYIVNTTREYPYNAPIREAP